MRTLRNLWKPRLQSFRNNRLSRKVRDRRARLYLFGIIGLLFWVGIFGIFYRVLTYFQRVEGFGDILANRLLFMVIVTFFALLLFSGIITSLSKLYLSRDLLLVHSLPVSDKNIFLARWLESAFDSSWMVLVYSFPVFLSYGVVYQSGILYYGTVMISMAAMCLVASGISVLAVMLIAVALPAGRIRTVSIFLGLAVLIILVMAIRMMRPEQLVNPDQFLSAALYLRSLETAGSPFLPTTWIYEAVQGAMSGASGNLVLLNASLAVSFAVLLIFINTFVAGRFYLAGFSKAQTSSARLFPAVRPGRNRWRIGRFLSSGSRAFIVKETKTFFRDHTQWPQLFLIGALILVYLYNFSVLPLDKTPIRTVYLQNLFSFLNMGLAGFVLTAIAARFVFPAVSTEGDAFWIVRSSPVSIRTYLWIKFFMYVAPLWVMAEILIVASNILLQVSPFMMTLSMATMCCMIPGVVAMGIGMGAMYPDFHAENPTESVTSFGGVLYMIFCTGFIALIIILEAGPVYTYFMASLRGGSLTILQWLWLISSFSLVILLSALAVFLPMHYGEKRLRQD